MYVSTFKKVGYELKVNTSDNDRVISRCLRSLGNFNRSTSSQSEMVKSESCFTGVIAHLSARDVVSIQDKYPGSRVSTSPQYTFIGFIKLSSGR